MFDVMDFSARRGAVVHLLPKVFDLLKNSNDARQAPKQPNLMLWIKAMHKELLNIKTRWLFLLDEQNRIGGWLFYRFSGAGEGDSIYIDDLFINDVYEQNGYLFTALLNKFQQDHAVKRVTRFFASERLKREEAQELLISAGWSGEDVYEDGYCLLGSLEDAVKILKIRYA